MSIADDLQQLSDLFERGLLTREQFAEAKERLLGEDPNAGVLDDDSSSSDPSAAIQQPADQSPPTQIAANVEPEHRAGNAAATASILSALSDRVKPMVSFISANRAPAAVVGAVVLILLIALIARPSEPPRPTATPAPTPQQQTLTTRDACVRNAAAWIDEFQFNPSYLYRTFGSDSVEARTIAELSNEYYTESFRIGPERAFANVDIWIQSFCRNNPVFSRRVAERPPR